MAGKDKQHPESLVRANVLTEALSRAAKGEVDDQLSISFLVTGGAGEQAYKLVLRATGGRIDSCALSCAMSDRHTEVQEAKIDPKALTSLYRSLLKSGLLSSDAKSPLFLPDTVVGIIEVALGETRHRVYFAADPDQAAVQGLTTPKGVLEAAEALYKAAEEVLEIDNVKP